MWQKLIHTRNDQLLTFQRIALAVLLFPHGAQKVFGWFGGYGFNATMTMFTDKMGISPVFALLAILAESVGVLFIFTGFLTRLGALGVACTMVVATLMVHYQNGFFMNWSGQQVGEGYEYHLLVLVLAISLIIRGGGAASLDLSIQKHDSSRTS